MISVFIGYTIAYIFSNTVIVSFSVQNYSTWGYQIWFAILRRQYKHVNKLELSEQEAKLQTTEMLVEKRRQQRGD